MNKDRFSGGSGDEDRKLSLCTLYEVLLIMCRIMAPLTPFFVESQYSNLKRALAPEEQLGSVHFDMIPEVRGDHSPHRPTTPPQPMKIHSTSSLTQIREEMINSP